MTKRSFLTGFTLVETLVVVIIIGILATLAFPAYTRYKEKAVDKEATQGLKLLEGAAKIKSVELGQSATKSDFACSDTADCNNKFKTQLSGTNWNFYVPNNPLDLYIRGGAQRNNPPSGYARKWNIRFFQNEEPYCTPDAGNQCP